MEGIWKLGAEGMVGEADGERGVEALEDAEPGMELSLEYLVKEGLRLCDDNEANSACASVGMASLFAQRFRSWLSCCKQMFTRTVTVQQAAGTAKG